METTYEDLDENGRYEIAVRVRGVTRPAVSNRAFELSVADVDGTRFQCIIWEKSEQGRTYEWEEGCWYRLGGVSVNEWPSGKVLHGTSALEVRRIDPPDAPRRTDVLYLTDSHLGKTTHSYGGESWSVSPADGFRAAVELAVEEDVDAVVHGGDLFHNSGSGITDVDVTVAREGLTALAEGGIPCYLIYGNHEREAGRRIIERFVDDGLVTHLGSRYERLGESLALYGVDHRSSWGDVVLDFEPAPAGMTTMLCVHQSVAPFTQSNSPDCSLAALSTAANVPLDLVVTGHVHTRIEHAVGDCTGLSGGSTARLGESRTDLRPSTERIVVEGGRPTVRRQYLGG